MTRTTTLGGNTCGACITEGAFGTVASEWAGKEEWSSKKEKCQTVEEKTDVITFSLQSVKHSTVEVSLLIHPSTLAKKDRRFSCVETAMLPKNG